MELGPVGAGSRQDMYKCDDDQRLMLTSVNFEVESVICVPAPNDHSAAPPRREATLFARPREIPKKHTTASKNARGFRANINAFHKHLPALASSCTYNKYAASHSLSAHTFCCPTFNNSEDNHLSWIKNMGKRDFHPTFQS
jgi:hypothetical protein